MVGAPSAPVEDWESSGDWRGSTAWQMVTDGAGQVWLAGPWQLTRLDPASGETSTWDATDDARFAWSDVILAPSAGPGVWILDGTRVRRFDGDQFTVDLTVPEEQLGPENIGSARYVHDIVEVGSEVWLSLADSRYSYLGGGGQVLRWADGQWTAMSQPGDGVGGYLAVDTQGGIWSGGWSESGVRRWDGSTWTVPGAGDPNAPTTAGDVAADPTGGVWMISYPGEPQGAELRWFDGTTWRAAVGVPGWQPGAGTLVASADGKAWVAWTTNSTAETFPAPTPSPQPSGLVRVTHDGTRQAFDPPQGSGGFLGFALALDTAAVVGDDGRVSRLDGEEWTDARRDPDE